MKVTEEEEKNNYSVTTNKNRFLDTGFFLANREFGGGVGALLFSLLSLRHQVVQSINFNLHCICKRAIQETWWGEQIHYSYEKYLVIPKLIPDKLNSHYVFQFKATPKWHLSCLLSHFRRDFTDVSGALTRSSTQSAEGRPSFDWCSLVQNT